MRDRQKHKGKKLNKTRIKKKTKNKTQDERRKYRSSKDEITMYTSVSQTRGGGPGVGEGGRLDREGWR